MNAWKPQPLPGVLMSSELSPDTGIRYWHAYPAAGGPRLLWGSDALEVAERAGAILERRAAKGNQATVKDSLTVRTEETP